VGRPDLSSDRCANDLATQLSDVLFTQGESRRIADDLADEATASLASGSSSPVSFFAASPSDVEYGFSIHHTSRGCLLRLYYRRRPGSEVTNTLTYIATRPLTGCTCAS
jgi:hypothetical protein